MSEDIQVFTSGSGNWTKPSWATAVQVICIGGGGGGGGGNVVAAGTTFAGGGAGGGASRTECLYVAADLGSTEPYSVGAGGTAGTAGTGAGGGQPTLS